MIHGQKNSMYIKVFKGDLLRYKADRPTRFKDDFSVWRISVYLLPPTLIQKLNQKMLSVKILFTPCRFLQDLQEAWQTDERGMIREFVASPSPRWKLYTSYFLFTFTAAFYCQITLYISESAFCLKFEASSVFFHFH